MTNTYSVQRTVPRFSILAVAKLADPASALVIVGQMTEISRKGCYVNTVRTVGLGTPLNVVISHEGENFTTAGKVIYVHQETGMGIAFVDAGEEQLEILDRWLAGALKTKPA